MAAGAAPPRLVPSDINLPGGRSGIEGLTLIRERVPQAGVVLTIHQESGLVFQALCAGAVGYLLKITPLPGIRQALLDVLSGGAPMSPAVARPVMRYCRPAAPRAALLDTREQQVVAGIEQGLSYKQIAARLGVSLNTVRAHIRVVYEKRQVNSKSARMKRIWPK